MLQYIGYVHFLLPFTLIIRNFFTFKFLSNKLVLVAYDSNEKKKKIIESKF